MVAFDNSLKTTSHLLSITVISFRKSLLIMGTNQEHSTCSRVVLQGLSLAKTKPVEWPALVNLKRWTNKEAQSVCLVQ